MLKSLTPNLMVEDVKKTLDFYREKLGFQVLATVPPEGDQLNWAMVQRDGVQLMFQSRHSLGEEVPALRDVPIGASQTFYIEVTGIDGLYDALKNDVEIVADMHTTFYNTREFYFKDINGYVLSFSERTQES